MHLPAYVRWEKPQQSACPESNALTSLCTLYKCVYKCVKLYNNLTTVQGPLTTKLLVS